MIILSLFDGISCWRVALERAGIPVEKYFASEIDKYAIQIAKKNFPDTIHIWSVTDIEYKNGTLSNSVVGESYNVEIDMIIGGSPCQDLSRAKTDGKGLQWERSGLFFEFVRLLKEVKPKYFLLENVASMKNADKETITNTLKEIFPDTECHLINSALVSAQNRKRYYWTNIPNIVQPEDKNILLKDVLQPDDEISKNFILSDIATFRATTNKRSRLVNEEENKTWTILANQWKQSTDMVSIRVGQFNSGGQWDRVYSPEGKSVSLSANGGGRWAKTGLYAIKQKPRGFNEGNIFEKKSPTITSCSWEHNNHIADAIEKVVIRKLTPIECERLQTLPDNYTEWISNTQRYKCIWNWWTVDVIAHILSFLK